MESQGMDRRGSPLKSATAAVVGALATVGHAALEGVDPAPRVVRAAGSQAALAMGAQDFRGNPALQGFSARSWEGGAGITRPLGLDGLLHQAAWVGWNQAPQKAKSVGARMAWRGFFADALYRDDAVFLAGAWRWKDVALGATGSGLRCDFGEGVVGSAFGGAVGVAGRWRDLVAGAAVSDASLLHAEPVWMREPAEGMLGMALVPRQENWRSGVTARWREGADLDWTIAQEVALPAGVDAGVGIGLEPFRLSGGVGWTLGPVRLDAAAEGDRVLGWQMHVAIGFALR